MLDFNKANQIAQEILGVQNSQVFAIPYRKDEAMLLAYAFVKNEEFYGIASIANTTSELISTQELLKKEKIELSIFESFNYAPFSARERFKETFGQLTKVYIDPETNHYYSHLDVFHGDDEIPPDVYKRIQPLYQEGKAALWSHFFVTNSAKELMLSIMTESEKQEWIQNFNCHLEKSMRCILNITPTVENPVILDFYGTDDVSFSKSLTNVQDAYNLMEEIATKGHDAVLTNMYCC